MARKQVIDKIEEFTRNDHTNEQAPQQNGQDEIHRFGREINNFIFHIGKFCASIPESQDSKREIFHSFFQAIAFLTESLTVLARILILLGPPPDPLASLWK